MFNFKNLTNSESEPPNHSQLNLNFYAEGITSLIPPLFTVEEFDFDTSSTSFKSTSRG